MDNNQEKPVKYGDVFSVSSELGSKLIAPEDASLMQSAESIALGHVPRGSPASLMQSAASQNERIGVIAPHEMTNESVTVSHVEVGGTRIVSESVAGEVNFILDHRNHTIKLQVIQVRFTKLQSLNPNFIK